MRAPQRRTGRLALAFAAAIAAGALTAWAEPAGHSGHEWQHEFAELTRDARDYLRPAITAVQPFPVARTMVSSSQ